MSSALKELNPDCDIFDELDVKESLIRELKNSTDSKFVIFENQTTANNLPMSGREPGVRQLSFKNSRYYNRETNTLLLAVQDTGL